MDAALDLAFDNFVENTGAAGKAILSRTANQLASFLDNIKLDTNTWRKVERHRWNTEFRMFDYSADALAQDLAPPSAIGFLEDTFETQDLGFWECHWDSERLERYLRVLLPAFDEDVWTEDVRIVFSELEKAMGGTGAVRKLSWPVSLILATKT